jgi:hypothetical protein
MVRPVTLASLGLAACALGCGSAGGSPSSVDAGSDSGIAYSVTLTLTPVTLQPGQEVFKCQDFANPFGGKSADIAVYENHMVDSHHMFLFYKPGAVDAPIQDCPSGGLEFHPFTFSSQLPDMVQTYPEHVGATIPASDGFTLNLHALNPGSAPVTATLLVTMHVAKPGLVTQHVGVLYLSQTNFTTPPLDIQPGVHTATASYTLASNVNLLMSASHMHQRATSFVARTSSGTELFATTQWSDPTPRYFSTPLALRSGTSITWSCTYNNDTAGDLVFGESAVTNVMCISYSTFFPVSDVNHPVVANFYDPSL